MSGPPFVAFASGGGWVLVTPLEPWSGGRLPLAKEAAAHLAAALRAGAVCAQVVRRDGARLDRRVAVVDLHAGPEAWALRLPLGHRCPPAQRRGGRVELWLRPRR